MRHTLSFLGEHLVLFQLIDFHEKGGVFPQPGGVLTIFAKQKEHLGEQR